MTTYTLTSDYLRKNFAETTLTFSIQKIKSKNDVVVIKPSIHFYNIGKTELSSETAMWIIGSTYNKYSYEINVSDIEDIAYYKVKLTIYNLKEGNALSFNHIQLAEGNVTEYHQPEQDIPKTRIRVQNNFYANLYTSSDESYLQVIRPYYNDIDTETLSKSKATVIAPHLTNEEETDTPSNLGLEFMNQCEQVIEILR